MRANSYGFEPARGERATCVSTVQGYNFKPTVTFLTTKAGADHVGCRRDRAVRTPRNRGPENTAFALEGVLHKSRTGCQQGSGVPIHSNLTQ